MDVILTAASRRDLEEIVKYIAQDSAEAARRLGNRLIDRAYSLKSMPEVGRKVQKWPGVRVLQEKSYLIFYRIELSKQIIEILSFWHGKRNLSSLQLPREKDS